MTSFSFIITGPTQSGKTTIANVILGKMPASYLKYEPFTFHVSSTVIDGRDVYVLDAASEIRPDTMRDMLRSAKALSQEVSVLHVIRDSKHIQNFDLGKNILKDEEIASRAHLVITGNTSGWKGPDISEIEKTCKMGKILFPLETGIPHDHSTFIDKLLKRMSPVQRTRGSYSDAPMQWSEHPPNESLYVCIVGCEASGKSSTGNLLLGVPKFPTELYDSPSIQSFITEKIPTQRLQNLGGMSPSLGRGTDAYVVDTPGELTSDTCDKVKKLQHKEKPKRMAILIIMQVNARMTPSLQKMVEILKEKFGREYLNRHAILVFTHGDEFDPLIRQKQYSSFNEFLATFKGKMQYLMELCRNRNLLVNNYPATEELEFRDAKALWKVICDTCT